MPEATHSAGAGVVDSIAAQGLLRHDSRMQELLMASHAAAAPSIVDAVAHMESPRSPRTPHQHEVYRDLTGMVDRVELHKGRHSTVWSATCQKTGKVVVIKAYSKQKLTPRQLVNVQREVTLLRFFEKIKCTGVVSLLASFEDVESIHLVFEACMRGDLYQLLVKNQAGPGLKEDYVCKQVVVPLLNNLFELHRLHIIHRDIKPENIFLAYDGSIQLGDFGLAVHKYQDNLTERVGTLDYMAPEVLSMPTPEEAVAKQLTLAPYDEKVDIWAVGVLAYELLAGRPPFEVEDPRETAQLIMAAKVPAWPPHMSKLCVDFITVTLAKEPADRPSAEQLLAHPWVLEHHSQRTPLTAASGESRISFKMLKAWLHASWGRTSSMNQGARLSGADLLTASERAPHSPSQSLRKLQVQPHMATRIARRALSDGDEPINIDKDPLLPPSMDADMPMRRTLPGHLAFGTGRRGAGSAAAAVRAYDLKQHDFRRTRSIHVEGLLWRQGSQARAGSGAGVAGSPLLGTRPSGLTKAGLDELLSISESRRESLGSDAPLTSRSGSCSSLMSGLADELESACNIQRSPNNSPWRRSENGNRSPGRMMNSAQRSSYSALQHAASPPQALPAAAGAAATRDGEDAGAELAGAGRHAHHHHHHRHLSPLSSVSPSHAGAPPAAGGAAAIAADSLSVPLPPTATHQHQHNHTHQQQHHHNAQPKVHSVQVQVPAIAPPPHAPPPQQQHAWQQPRLAVTAPASPFAPQAHAAPSRMAPAACTPQQERKSPPYPQPVALYGKMHTPLAAAGADHSSQGVTSSHAAAGAGVTATEQQAWQCAQAQATALKTPVVAKSRFAR